MRRVVRFGSWYFPTIGKEEEFNFPYDKENLSLHNVSGGFDRYGLKNSLGKEATITVRFVLIDDDVSTAETKRQEMLTAFSSGVQRLYTGIPISYKNLCDNPSVEVNLNGWTTNATSLTRVTGGLYGTYCARLDGVSGPSAVALHVVQANGNKFPVTAGGIYHAIVHMKINSFGGSIHTGHIGIEFYNNVDTIVGTTGDAYRVYHAIDGTPWQKTVMSALAPATSVTARVHYEERTNNWTAGKTIDFDGVAFIEGKPYPDLTYITEYTPYVDGNQPYCRWNGTPNQSTSTGTQYPDDSRFVYAKIDELPDMQRDSDNQKFIPIVAKFKVVDPTWYQDEVPAFIASGQGPNSTTVEPTLDFDSPDFGIDETAFSIPSLSGEPVDYTLFASGNVGGFASATFNINNRGNKKTRKIIFRIISNGGIGWKDVEIINNTNGQSVKITDTAISGTANILSINCFLTRSRESTDSGATWVNNWANLSTAANQPYLMELEPGINNMTITNAATSPNMKILIWMQPAFNF